MMACSPEGEAQTAEVELVVPELIGSDAATLTVWSRTLEQQAAKVASGTARVRLEIPASDFLAVHVAPR